MNYQRIFRDRRHTRLLTAARSGDGDAFKRLYRELFEPVRGYLGGRLENLADAEDLTSRVFHRFLDRLDHFDPRRGSVLGWLLTIAHNVLVDHWKSARPAIPVEEVAEKLVGGGSDPLEAVLRDERVQMVHRLLGDLHPEAKWMLDLRFRHELRYRDIGAFMGLTEQAVKKRFSRTLGKLREKITTAGKEEVKCAT